MSSPTASLTVSPKSDADLFAMHAPPKDERTAASGWVQSFACRSLIDRSSSKRSLASVPQQTLREG